MVGSHSSPAAQRSRDDAAQWLAELSQRVTALERAMRAPKPRDEGAEQLLLLGDRVDDVVENLRGLREEVAEVSERLQTLDQTSGDAVELLAGQVRALRERSARHAR